MRVNKKEPNVQSALYDVLQHFNMSMEQAGTALINLIKRKAKTITQHCGDPNPHTPHTYYGPSNKPGETRQVQYSCPGTK